MKEFALIFRLTDMASFRPTPEQIQERMDWLGKLSAEDKLVDKGNTLLPMPGSAKTISADQVISDGPFTEGNDFVSGYVVVRSANIDEAVDIARNNPIFQVGGNVEVREVLKRN